MIRFIIVLIAVIFFLIVSLPIQLVLWLIRFVSPSVCDTVSRAIVGWAFRVCIWLSGVKLTVIGEENYLLPRSESDRIYFKEIR